MADVLKPSSLIKRSFLYRIHEKAGGVFIEENGFAVPSNYGQSVREEITLAHQMGIADLSHVSRTGFKGWHAASWLEKKNCKFGLESNFSYLQSTGERILRLSPNEFAIVGKIVNDRDFITELNSSLHPETDEGVFIVPRSDTNCWLKVMGVNAPSMLAKVCAVDLRPQIFPDGAIAQTNIARLNCIVTRHDVGLATTYDILTDCASADYFWQALLDAMDEFSGKTIVVVLPDLAERYLSSAMFEAVPTGIIEPPVIT